MECVLNEHELAVAVGEALLTSFTTMLRIDERLFHEAWDFSTTDKRIFTESFFIQT